MIAYFGGYQNLDLDGVLALFVTCAFVSMGAWLLEELGFTNRACTISTLAGSYGAAAALLYAKLKNYW